MGHRGHPAATPHVNPTIVHPARARVSTSLYAHSHDQCVHGIAFPVEAKSFPNFFSRTGGDSARKKDGNGFVGRYASVGAPRDSETWSRLTKVARGLHSVHCCDPVVSRRCRWRHRSVRVSAVEQKCADRFVSACRAQGGTDSLGEVFMDRVLMEIAPAHQRSVRLHS